MGIDPTRSLEFRQPRDLETGDPGRGVDIRHVSDDKQPGEHQHEAIQRFGLHCKSFYDSSLLISDCQSFLDQDKNVGYAMSDDAAHVNEQTVSQGRIVLEALSRVGEVLEIVQNCHVSKSAEIQDTAQKLLAKLRQEHQAVAECHRNLLDECGLLDIDRFVRSCCSNDQDGATSYQKYVQIRDAIRRRSHKFAMVQRQASLLRLLSEIEKAQSDGETESRDRAMSLTQIFYVKFVISTIEEFARKYSPNIGSHSFLAGLYRFIQLQLHPSDETKSSNDPSYIVQWNFLGSVLTEACHSREKGDTPAYARDAATVLLAFLTWVKTTDVEIGDFSTAKDDFNLGDSFHPSFDIKEIQLSFQVNKYVSNATLRRILSVLPNPKVLDARATGSVEVIDVENASNKRMVQASRINADGHMDEVWPRFSLWQFCSVL